MGSPLRAPGGGVMDAGEPNAATPDEALTRAARRDRALRRIVIGLFGLVAVVFVLAESNPSCYWENIQDHLGAWRAWAGEHPALAALLFFLAYATFTSLPLPVVT